MVLKDFLWVLLGDYFKNFFIDEKLVFYSLVYVYFYDFRVFEFIVKVFKFLNILEVIIILI